MAERLEGRPPKNSPGSTISVAREFWAKVKHMSRIRGRVAWDRWPIGSIRSEGIASINCTCQERRARVASIMQKFEWLIQDAQYHAVREVVGLQTLFEANKEIDKETNRLFDSWMDITTVEHQGGRRRVSTPVRVQQTAMQTVRDEIQAFQRWKQEQEKRAEDEGEDRGEDEGFDEENRRGEDHVGADEEVDGGLRTGVSDEEVE
ncbi:hypothetical protein BDZ45DRAFT_698555 [Acephala macrosclerotiorum]|nr:hypothetical protein BDZ45DRAFT_698555 [Acephala macrosclerotiorum]